MRRRGGRGYVSFSFSNLGKFSFLEMIVGGNCNGSPASISFLDFNIGIQHDGSNACVDSSIIQISKSG